MTKPIYSPFKTPGSGYRCQKTMSKVFGLQGYIRGKLGNTVFAIRNGEQIARQYNPNPTNPKSATQTANRARLKLLSQLGAALQPVIAIPRVGMASPRNGFTQANYQYTAYAGDNATIDLADIQLTKSSVALSGFSADRSGGAGIVVGIMENVAATNDAVVYVVLRRTDASKVAVASSMLVREAGVDGTFAATLPYQDGDIAVCAYGIRYNTGAARSAFGNLNVPSATGVAKLFASRTLTESDATMTETRGLFMAAADVSGETAGVVRYTIGVTAVGDGTATGGGRYEIGTQVTLRATPQSGATFQGWYLNSISGTLLSSNAEYTLTVEGAMSIVAKFSALPKTITVSASPAEGGSVSGGGSKEVGTSCTVNATANSGYAFSGWYEGETLVTSTPSYSFLVENNRTLVARFTERTGVRVTSNLLADVSVSVYPESGSTPTGVFNVNNVCSFEGGDTVRMKCSTAVNEYTSLSAYWRNGETNISEISNPEMIQTLNVPANCDNIYIEVVD